MKSLAKEIFRAGCWAMICLMTALPPVAAQSMEAVPGVVVGYEPSPSLWDRLFGNARYTASPSIVVLPNGDYLIGHNIFGSGSGADVSGETRLYLSSDQGATWTRLSNLMDMKRGSLFVHQEAVYVWGFRNNSGDILLYRSDDHGESWTTPSNASTGLLREGNFGGTPFNPVVHGGRIWVAQSGSRIMSAPVGANLLAASSWTLTNGANTQSGPLGSGLIVTEAQIFASARTGVVIMPKVGGLSHSVLIRPGFNPATIVHPEDDDWVSLPGGDKKFGGAYDPVSDRFFILSNPVLPVHAGYGVPELIRNTGALLSSRDLRHWNVEKIFLYSPNIGYEAFQYFNFEIEGDDLLVASRTAFDVGSANRPPRGHDSNLITFHRVSGFREARPEYFLVPEPANNRVSRYERTQHAPAPLGSFTLGESFAGEPLNGPVAHGQESGGDVYVRETGGRVLRFDVLGNFVEVVESAPIPLTEGELDLVSPDDGARSWIAPGPGNWSEIENWFYWNRPDTNAEAAVFGSAIAADSVVTVDGAFTVRELRFQAEHRHTFGGPGSLTLEVEEGRARVALLRGDHEILVPVTLKSDTDLEGDADASVAFRGGFDFGGRELRLSGAAGFRFKGPLTVSGGGVVHLDGGELELEDGALRVFAGGSLTGAGVVGGDLVTAPGATVAGTGEGMVVEGTLSGAGAVENITVAGVNARSSTGAPLELRSTRLSAGGDVPLIRIMINGPVAEHLIGFDGETDLSNAAVDIAFGSSPPGSEESFRVFHHTGTGEPEFAFHSVTVPENWILINGLLAHEDSLPPAGPTFAEWAASHDLAGEDAEIQANPAGDGFSNMEKFVFGKNPTIQVASLARVSRGGDLLIMRWNRPFHDGVTFVIEKNAALDPAGWQPLDDPVFTVMDEPDEVPPDGYERVEWSHQVDDGDGHAAFFRIIANVPLYLLP